MIIRDERRDVRLGYSNEHNDSSTNYRGDIRRYILISQITRKWGNPLALEYKFVLIINQPLHTPGCRVIEAVIVTILVTIAPTIDHILSQQGGQCQGDSNSRVSRTLHILPN